MLRSNVLEDDVESVLTAALSDVSGTVYAINPSRKTVEKLVSVLSNQADAPAVRTLADPDLLKSVTNDFLIASEAADLEASGHLELNELTETLNHSLLVTAEGAVSLVSVGETVAGLVTDERAFVDDAMESFERQWTDSEPFSLRTPPMSRVRETLESDIGPDTANDFDAVLASLQTARGDGDGLDEVTISLLVAARNGVLLYDISKWGEDVGLASKATFSRTKSLLEDRGLIDTEKVPIDIGRPRLRLLFGDERLEEATAHDLAGVAQRILSS